jgi:putative ABC transport system substrate-binding protein
VAAGGAGAAGRPHAADRRTPKLASDDPQSQVRTAVFAQGLQQLGWSIGRNVQIEYRWSVGDSDRIRKYAAELVAFLPDVILANGGTIVGVLQQATRTVPIVFVQVTDPVGGGYVASLARPGGNATGFAQFEYGLSSKWLELLKQLVPAITRAAVIRDPARTSGVGQFAAIQAVAPSFGVELTPIDSRDATGIERAVTAFANSPNVGLIVESGTWAEMHRDLIIGLTAQLRLPAVYHYREFVAGGGLISYGPDPVDPYRRAAEYVDRILKGERPSDLPVQQTTKYELVINLKTAKTLGLTVPPNLLATADEVIE